MSFLSRGSRPLLRLPSSKPAICAECRRRTFLSIAPFQSGHNKWSKIKHEKAAADAKKNVQRSFFTKHITLYSKLYGANPDDNPALATILATAKKAGVPKTTIEAAIARGQGRSSEGAVLDNLTFEAIVAPSVAVIIEVETDSKLRALQDLNVIIKRAKGATSTTKFLFSRVGRVVFEKEESTTSEDQEVVDLDRIMDDAIEAGAEDLENDDEGNIVVWTQPTQTTQVCRAIGEKFGLRAQSSDIVWAPNEDTKVAVDSSQDLNNFIEMLTHLRTYPDVQAVYTNIDKGDMTDEEWESIVEAQGAK
ncbi:transcriptional regulator TACO1-like protein [Podospora appendiculata]|uniref:Transcriptional regulator TACO1-like protein n=1 Tax=Podospora appendiculata TaxID=314037 RepID=A0AAE0XF37_9PEZI|nr:transcriptional regulator TACO1-like protein [Podospora appendiculata]